MDDRWVTHEPEVHLILCSIQLLTSVDIGSIGLEDDKIDMKKFTVGHKSVIERINETRSEGRIHVIMVTRTTH